MPIYEYYCPDNNKIYQFFAKTLAQGKTIPRCPDGEGLKMEKLISPFAVVGKGKKESAGDGGADLPGPQGPGPGDDPRMEAAMSSLESEFANVDENDPRAMGRMMRRMAELTGEKIDGEMEEVVRKLEEGADPETLDDQFGGAEEPGAGGPPGEDPGAGPPEGTSKEGRHRFRARRGPPVRDPKLYDYD